MDRSKVEFKYATQANLILARIMQFTLRGINRYSRMQNSCSLVHAIGMWRTASVARNPSRGRISIDPEYTLNNFNNEREYAYRLLLVFLIFAPGILRNKSKKQANWKHTLLVFLSKSLCTHIHHANIIILLTRYCWATRIGDTDIAQSTCRRCPELKNALYDLMMVIPNFRNRKQKINYMVLENIEIIFNIILTTAREIYLALKFLK